MRWDAARCATTVTLSQHDATASSSKSAWACLIGDEYLSSGTHEITLQCDNVDNISLFFGVASPSYWDEVQAAAADEEEGEALPRDSKSVICMHGDGRCFIKGKEKDQGMMRVATGDPISIVLDFERGVVVFKLTRVTKSGRAKETIAEIPGLFASATAVVAFGGRDQQITLAECIERKPDAHAGEAGSGSRKKVRDVFAAALDGERIAPVPFASSKPSTSYDEQIRDMAATMETSM